MKQRGSNTARYSIKRGELLYFDAAATSLYRPRRVQQTVARALELGNPGRGGHRAAMAAAEELFAVRERIARHFGAESDGVCFFYNATTVLNVVVKSLIKPGGRLLISNMEHNALRRPAYALKKKGISVDFFEGYGSDEEIVASFAAQLRKKPDLAAFIHTSNICPQTLPIKKLCSMARAAGVMTLIDCAQSAGHLPLDLEDLSAAGIVMPSHKGLMGIAGAGVLVAKKELKEALERSDTVMEGGSGLHSFEKGMPEYLPERLEWGTPALPAILSVGAGISFIEEIGYAELSGKIRALCARAAEGIGNIEGLRLLGIPRKGAECGPLLFVSGKKDLSALCAELYAQGVCLREGFHCAPLAHERIGSNESGGARISFSCFNNMWEVERFLRILNRAAK